MPAFEALLDGLVDYAGLYPPASLDMPAMVEQYAMALASEEAWMVGRVIVPVSGLDDFEDAAIGALPGHEDDDPWVISALVNADQLEADLDRVLRFNEVHAEPGNGLALIDAVEVKASDAAGIESIAAALPEGLFAFVEIPVDRDPRGLLAQLAGDELAAKVRTGGIEPHLYPDVADVAAFIVHAAAAEVPFKATAGMHHPLPNDNPAVPARQLGFVNVFLAAALAQHEGLDAAAVAQVLELDDPGKIGFDGAEARIGDHVIDAACIEESRLTFCTSFGSCSIDEPRDDLAALGWLEAQGLLE
ncbi:MAG: hypothetical protein MK101_04460 [Phycisphaerales bacterium]|nr:hypothetical protein [Phycisphaerales bacterium]